ncbi:hypothetical protein XU18_2863 [Perkinsela sp. CCAP 1560/4]|nr:hypothetical protein XU18_2863 [Perkinsela sp. CCAP 1560/4]|eukprot:KNH06358.1 hypothetical protein XU18_2863 [Perkinsela sp. CCAP 1560/4]
MNKPLISLGGWCGPALALGKMDLRKKAYPFDFSRVTFDGIIHFIKNGFQEGFFPPVRPFCAECVGQWILFRSQHCAFAHYNLNDTAVQDGFKRKFLRFNDILKSDDKVIFLRTITARRPLDEIDMLPTFTHVVAQQYPRLQYRLVMIAHDQADTDTECLGYVGQKNISLWRLRYDRSNFTENTSLFDMTSGGYTQIIEASQQESHWRALHSAETAKFRWKEHDNLTLIDGTAMVRGSCKGFGSTATHIAGTCIYCDTVGGHSVTKQQPRRPFTQEEDEIILMNTYSFLAGADAVSVVEDVADQTKRGSLEIIERIYSLTNSKKLLDSISGNLLSE